MEHLIKDPEKFFPFLHSFIYENFKEALNCIEKDLRFNKIHLKIKSEKGVLSEEKVLDSLKEFFKSGGLTSEEGYNAFLLFKNEDWLGCFNSDIIINDDHDLVLISVSHIFVPNYKNLIK